MNIQNELGVIVMFAQACQSNDWRINHIQSEFPDAIIQDKNGDTFRAEFEFCASNFKAHQHDLCQCDVIICWENDWDDCPLTVWSMKSWEDPTITIRDRKDLIIASLTIENERLKRRLSRLETKTQMQSAALDAEYTGMDAESRRNALADFYNENPDLKSDEIAPTFGVSASTIRRDLGILADDGRIRRNGHKLPAKVEEAEK